MKNWKGKQKGEDIIVHLEDKNIRQRKEKAKITYPCQASEASDEGLASAQLLDFKDDHWGIKQPKKDC